MPFSISSQSSSVMLPARFSSQYFQTSEPEPRILPCQLPRSIGPAGTRIAGMPMLIAPISKAGRGLVAAAHQHRAVDRMAAQELLGLHRQEVAIEHGGRLHEHFGERHRRQFERETAGLVHAALHVFRARAQVRVTGIDVAPGIDDADDGLLAPVIGVIAELAQPRAVAKGAKIADPEPAMAAEVFRTFSCRHFRVFVSQLWVGAAGAACKMSYHWLERLQRANAPPNSAGPVSGLAAASRARALRMSASQASVWRRPQWFGAAQATGWR